NRNVIGARTIGGALHGGSRAVPGGPYWPARSVYIYTYQSRLGLVKSNLHLFGIFSQIFSAWFTPCYAVRRMLSARFRSRVRQNAGSPHLRSGERGYGSDTCNRTLWESNLLTWHWVQATSENGPWNVSCRVTTPRITGVAPRTDVWPFQGLFLTTSGAASST